MSPNPVIVGDIFPKLEKFKDFLNQRGAEILEPTNELELLRFRTPQATSVVYKDKKGRISFFQEAEEAWNAYKDGHPWRASHVPKRRSTGSHDIPLLIKRDGDLCFFCQKKVLNNGDASVEHLVSRTHNGPEHLSNKYLAHKDCNDKVGYLSAPEKIAIHTNAVITRILDEVMLNMRLPNVHSR